MADYIKVNNGSGNGEIGLSRRVFEAIATEAINRVGNVKLSQKSKTLLPFNLSKPIRVTFRSDDSVEIKVSIDIKKGSDANKICLAIQEEIARSISAYTESVIFKVELKVVSID